MCMASLLDKTGLVLCVGKLCGLKEYKLKIAGASQRTLGTEKQESFCVQMQINVHDLSVGS